MCCWAIFSLWLTLVNRGNLFRQWRPVSFDNDCKRCHSTIWLLYKQKAIVIAYCAFTKNALPNTHYTYTRQTTEAAETSKVSNNYFSNHFAPWPTRFGGHLCALLYRRFRSFIPRYTEMHRSPQNTVKLF